MGGHENDNLVVVVESAQARDNYRNQVFSQKSAG
jgi:hypothetical protein